MWKRGDPSRFITHGGNFLSSIKDIENRFFRASECGKEVSRMLETNKVVSKFSDGKEPPKQVTGYYMVPVAIFTVVFIKKSPHFSIER
ncbi:hypothetical protein C5167_049106 [Papaver somniferum]|uniref:DUF632 domain-containing protein n=1 Tax=Papaver somniferum TaxID=3469 RepID=A0A4Y7KP14_PAPSO|nr:hypothetical protein C5167_049106 [Papaver somniferum]